MPKPKLKKEVQNKIISIMAKNQNQKSKLNAGQLREATNLFIGALIELSHEDKAQLIKGIV